MANTLSFLLQIVRRLEAATLPVWVFGGWAEELWRISQPRMHNDIDFLYPAASFEQFDHFISQANDVHEIRLKRFSHKRAILCQHVMIEFLLVQHEQNVHFTNFFSGRYKL